MSDTIPTLVFSYREDELWAFRELVGRRVNREAGSAWLWIVLFAMVFGVGLPVLALNRVGLLARVDMPAVLLTAYVAFGAGVLLIILLLRVQQRRFTRKLYAASSQPGESWRFSGDEAGIVCKSSLYETSVAWRAVTSVEPVKDAVAIWFARLQNFCIPARAFADNSARDRFIAAVAERIKAAQAGGNS